MNIVGISAFFHDSACCLIKDGVLVAAAQEERFSRIKADPSIPGEAFQYCLRQGNITVSDLDCVAYYEDPVKKFARQLWSGLHHGSEDVVGKLNPFISWDQIRELLGYEGLIKNFDHHLSHAASSYFFSGFEEAAILTVDGVGEWATTTYGRGEGDRLDLFEEVHFPNSLGLLYSTITSFLGFGVNDGEYKVMGLAPYGEPRFIDQINALVANGPAGQYQLKMEYFNFVNGKTMYSDQLIEKFGMPVRKEGDRIEQCHKDIARSLQIVLEDLLLGKARYLYDRVGSENLCMAGGVALNCVANSLILKRGRFKRLFVQPAANDAGGSIGAAAMACVELSGKRPSIQNRNLVYLGPDFSPDSIHTLLRSTSLTYIDCRFAENRLLQLTAKRLAEGKVIGWFQGRMEFGPRSLGSRSILADPRDDTMRDRINRMVKKREGFRPFAPSVIADCAREHFDLDHPSPYMLEICQVISSIDLPGITHVDGSARVQTVHRETNSRFHLLLVEFNKLTDCPILLNTSFNIKGEPIVCSPEDAVRCFINTEIDCLVIGDFIIDREDNNLEILRLLLTSQGERSNVITADVYTFV